MRRFLIQWLRRCYPPAPLPEQIHRILVVRIDDRVGNLLLTTPLFRALHTHLPEVRLDVLCPKRTSFLLCPEIGIERVLTFDKRWLWQCPWRLWQLVKTLRQAQYDVVIDAAHQHHFSLTSALLAIATGCQARIGHGRTEPADDLLSVAVPVTDLEQYEIVGKLSLLHPLGITETDLRMLSPLVGQGPSLRIQRFLSHLPTQPIVFNIGARKSDRSYSPAFWGQVAAQLMATPQTHPSRENSGEVAGRHCVIFAWGPKEKKWAQEAMSVACKSAFAASHARNRRQENTERTAPMYLLAPATDLLELGWLFAGAALVVCADTGPMHLAVAVGTPTLGLFLQKDYKRWGHSYPPHQVLYLPEENETAVEQIVQNITAMTQPG